VLPHLAAFLLAALSFPDSAPQISASDLKNRVGDFFSCSYEQTVSHAPATPVNTGENQIHGYETASGIPHYRARYYDPGLGRFISEDPIGFGDLDAPALVYQIRRIFSEISTQGDYSLGRYLTNSPRSAFDSFGLSPAFKYTKTVLRASGAVIGITGAIRFKLVCDEVNGIETEFGDLIFPSLLGGTAGAILTTTNLKLTVAALGSTGIYRTPAAEVACRLVPFL